MSETSVESLAQGEPRTVHSEHKVFSFGECALDLGRGALLRAGIEVKLRPKSFALLQLLLERHGQLVTKDEIMGVVWSRLVVTDDALTQRLMDVRRAIGDDSQSVIRTVPRRGYILDAPVVTTLGHAGTANVEPSAADPAAQTWNLRDTPNPPDPARIPDPPEAPNPPWSARPPHGSQRARGAATAVAGILVLAIVAILAWRGTRPATQDLARKQAATQPASATPVAPHNSIAVLPFVNMSPEPDQVYFSDGISEEILDSLAQSPQLHVIARTSSFSFKDRKDVDIAEIAARLNVAYVLEGSVRKSGDRLRITAQLVDAASSTHLWSQVYDRSGHDALAVQADIATRVADALKVQLLTGARATAGEVPRSAAAHDTYLRAKFFYGRHRPGDVDRAKAYFEEALRIDPAYALAWTGLATLYGFQMREGILPVDVALEKQRAAIERALAIDPMLVDAHLSAADHFVDTGDAQRATWHLQQARALDRNDPHYLSWLSTKFAYSHRFKEWIALERRLLSLDPVSADARVNFANYLLTTGHLEEARSEFVKAVELNPDLGPGVEVDLARILILERRYDDAVERAQRWQPGDDRDQILAMAYDGLGRPADADAAIQSLAQRTGPGNAVRLAEIHAHRGEPDKAFRWMSTAYDRLPEKPWRTPDREWIYPLNLSPFLVSLYSDPRWRPLEVRGWPPVAEQVHLAIPDDDFG